MNDCNYPKCMDATGVCGLSGGGPDNRVTELCRTDQRYRDLWVREGRSHGGVVKRGPGGELKAMLAAFGVTGGPNCKCTARAAEMDANGPQWCLDNIHVCVGWLKEEAVARNMPFSSVIANMLVRRAVSLSRKSLEGQ